MLEDGPTVCMTSIETPRLLSEYFAARAQSLGCIPPNAMVDLTNVIAIIAL
jgi:hypothetical protein